jgi:hypothetical protein
MAHRSGALQAHEQRWRAAQFLHSLVPGSLAMSIMMGKTASRLLAAGILALCLGLATPSCAVAAGADTVRSLYDTLLAVSRSAPAAAMPISSRWFGAFSISNS